VRRVDSTPPERIDQHLPEQQRLDVGVLVFDPNIPETYEARIEELVNSGVRTAESYYMPYVLKDVLVSTGYWGAVRVVPEPTQAVDLLVRGTILDSQGERLRLRIAAEDARGVVWFRKNYQMLASKYAYEDHLPPGVDAFQGLYARIADDLAAHYDLLAIEPRLKIRRSAEMRFAWELLPSVYGKHVEETAEGKIRVKRLPARDDPMMDHVREIRKREQMFIDALDQHYDLYHGRLAPIYEAWRKKAYQEAMARLEATKRRKRRLVAGTISIIGGLVGGPMTLSGVTTGAQLLEESFHTRENAGRHAEALREVSASMEGEIAPYTLDLENETIELAGNVAEQYQKLRRVLRELYTHRFQLQNGAD